MLKLNSKTANILAEEGLSMFRTAITKLKASNEKYHSFR